MEMNVNFIGKNIENLGDKFTKHIKDISKNNVRNMKEAIGVVYDTATTKRPDIGRLKTATGIIEVTRLIRKGSAGEKLSRISDPKAKLGVPVRTGNLRDSIKKKVDSSNPNHVVGRVWVDLSQAPYAGYVERGTSKMQKRPFMRVALDINREKIRKILKKNA